MVAISLYRGSLHRVPDVTRRWLMPTPAMSLKNFKTLIGRRSKAISRLHSTTATLYPNPNSKQQEQKRAKDKQEAGKDNGCSITDVHVQPQLELGKINHHEEGTSKDGAFGGVKGAKDNDCLISDIRHQLAPEKANHEDEGTSKDEVSEGVIDHRVSLKPGIKDHQVSLKPGVKDHQVLLNPVDGSVSAPCSERDVPGNVTDTVQGNGNSKTVHGQTPLDPENPNVETSDKVDKSSDKEKRKKEIEEKLQILNTNKHNLVQVLKQILKAEEEFKQRNSMQGSSSRPSVPLQVDVTNDSGSVTRHMAPRMSSEANLGGDMEGGEADDVLNHNMHSRHLLRMSSTSPSSESPLRRPAYFQHNVVPQPSPSRFAPTGHPPTVCVSGTNYIPSSPSPAASGGTSVFRDARLPSPWN